MAYRIQYSPETAKRYSKVKKAPQVHIGKWVRFLLVVSAVLWLYWNGIPDFLIPGDPVVTKAAASTFIGEIQNGSSVNEAVTVFCKEIIDGAKN